MQPAHHRGSSGSSRCISCVVSPGIGPSGCRGQPDGVGVSPGGVHNSGNISLAASIWPGWGSPDAESPEFGTRFARVNHSATPGRRLTGRNRLTE